MNAKKIEVSSKVKPIKEKFSYIYFPATSNMVKNSFNTKNFLTGTTEKASNIPSLCLGNKTTSPAFPHFELVVVKECANFEGTNFEIMFADCLNLVNMPCVDILCFDKSELQMIKFCQ